MTVLFGAFSPSSSTDPFLMRPPASCGLAPGDDATGNGILTLNRGPRDRSPVDVAPRPDQRAMSLACALGQRSSAAYQRRLTKALEYERPRSSGNWQYSRP